MTSAPDRTPKRRRVLPAGENGSLWETRPSCGIFEFRGVRLRLMVEDPAEILFPTDCGLSLLSALNGDDAPVLEGVNALDLGAGSGIYSVALLAAGAERVTALDVNPASVAQTVANVTANGLDGTRLTCVTAPLEEYTPDERFDLVITNPPHLPYDPTYARGDGLETALVARGGGRAVYDAVIDRVDRFLAPGGSLLMAHSSLADIPRTVAELTSRGYETETIEIFEMDIPLLAYAEHMETLQTRLKELRAAGRAEFDGSRFAVHALLFRRPPGPVSR
ncbi:methyltransferase [Streptomyces actuosus]|uniref:Methyltransferase n=1 Tax=Streptomyces actuosus TaxID=1885 RepID=A0ABS2VIK6_STRAS|nr:methyltransferase [Streptomyces actuosus]MBN0042922.1 methyltransferase [Streptomyces actuosus]